MPRSISTVNSQVQLAKWRAAQINKIVFGQTRMGRAQYRRYRASPYWRWKSALTHKLAGFRCEWVENGVRCCNPSEQVDHLNYDHLWNEKPGEDTQALCGDHHYEKHHGKKYVPDNDNNPPTQLALAI